MTTNQLTPEQKETAFQRLKSLSQTSMVQASLRMRTLVTALSIYCLVPGTIDLENFSPMLASFVGVVAGDALFGLIERIASAKDKSNDDLFAMLEASANSIQATDQQLANLPTRREIHAAVNLLAEQAVTNQTELVVNQQEMLVLLQQLFANRPVTSLFYGVPDKPNHFLGRDDLLNDLATKLTSGHTIALSAEGLPGVGKTALAVALANNERVLEYFSDGVLWAGLGTEPDVLGALNSWAEALGSDVSQYVEPTARSQAVKNLIAQRRLLLVIDDAWDVNAAKLLRCGGPNCTHFLTTRLKDVARDFAGQANVYFVPELADEPAFALLKVHAPQACRADPQAARTLVEAVGRLPLALELLGGYLGATRRSATPNLSRNALTDMADAKKRLVLASKRLGDLKGSEKTLRETILLSLEGIEEEPGGSEAVDAFYALGAFAPKPADFTWKAACVVANCDEETMAWLLARNLVQQVEAVEGRLTLHQSLADVARQEMDKLAVARHQDYYLEIVNEDRENWQRIASIYEQINWAWNSLIQDIDILRFINALHVYHERRGLWSVFLSWANRGLIVTKNNNFRQDEGKLLNYLGRAYSGLGNLEEALIYYFKSLYISREIFDRKGEATTLNNIGLAYYRLEELENALVYCEEALPIRREIEDRVGEAVTLSNIGLVYAAMGQPHQALKYYYDALPIRIEIEDRAGEATTLNNIGDAYRILEQSTDALENFDKALLIMQEIGYRIGEATVLKNIGLVYEGMGLSEEALSYYNQALSIRFEVGDRWGEAITRYCIVRIHRNNGKLLQAHAEMKIVVDLSTSLQSSYLTQFQKELSELETEIEQDK